MSSACKDALAKIERLDRAFAAGVRALSVIDLGNYRKIKQKRNEMVSILEKAGYK